MPPLHVVKRHKRQRPVTGAVTNNQPFNTTIRPITRIPPPLLQVKSIAVAEVAVGAWEVAEVVEIAAAVAVAEVAADHQEEDNEQDIFNLYIGYWRDMFRDCTRSVGRVNPLPNPI
jgi:hypothetical protein